MEYSTKLRLILLQNTYISKNRAAFRIPRESFACGFPALIHKL